MELKEYRKTLQDKDAKWKEAKYELGAEEQDMEDTASDIIEAMEEELDNVLEDTEKKEYN